MFSLILFIFTPLLCQAAHFEGGSISYKISHTTNSTVSIIISQTYIYVYPTIYCNNSYIINQSPKLDMTGRGENGQYLVCTANCSTSGGYVPVPLNCYCTDYSSTMNITIGERYDLVNVSIGSYFIVSFASNNWRLLTLPTGNGGSLGWSLSCTIDLRLRPNGNLNNPPVAAIISPIYIPVGIQQAIFIPTIDADNDKVRCRFAVNNSNSDECANVCPPASLPNGTIMLSNCTLFITGANVGDWYAVAIMIEDFIDSTSTTPLSSVPVQFLINVQGISSCPTRPLLTGSDSQTGQCVGIQVGQTYIIELIAKNFCPNSTTIKDIATLSFPVVVKTPIVQNTTTLWSVTLTWIPTASTVGSQILCAVAVDSNNVQSNQYCMTFIVGQGSVPICPGQIEMTTQITTTETSQSTSTEIITTSTSETSSTSAEIITTSTSETSSTSTEIIITSTSESLPTSADPSYELDTSNSIDTSDTVSQMLEQSTNIDTTTSSPTSSLDSTIIWALIAALVTVLALILLTLCLCCCCYGPLYLCCPLKRRRKQELPQKNNYIHLPIYTYMIYNSKNIPKDIINTTRPPISKNIPMDIIDTTRPPSSETIPNDSIDTSRSPSSGSSQYADDIQLTILPTRRNKVKPHYTLALNRSPRMTPEDLSRTLAINRAPRMTPNELSPTLAINRAPRMTPNELSPTLAINRAPRMTPNELFPTLAINRSPRMTPEEIFRNATKND